MMGFMKKIITDLQEAEIERQDLFARRPLSGLRSARVDGVGEAEKQAGVANDLPACARTLRLRHGRAIAQACEGLNDSPFGIDPILEPRPQHPRAFGGRRANRREEEQHEPAKLSE
jgi:hypothetical protein